MQRVLSLAAAFWGCLATAANLHAEDAVYHATERGRDWYSKGEYNKAIAEFTEAIRLIPVVRVSDANRASDTAALYANRGNAWREKATAIRPSLISTRRWRSTPAALSTMVAATPGARRASTTRPSPTMTRP